MWMMVMIMFGNHENGDKEVTPFIECDIHQLFCRVGTWFLGSNTIHDCRFPFLYIYTVGPRVPMAPTWTRRKMWPTCNSNLALPLNWCGLQRQTMTNLYWSMMVSLVNKNLVSEASNGARDDHCRHVDLFCELTIYQSFLLGLQWFLIFPFLTCVPCMM